MTLAGAAAASATARTRVHLCVQLSRQPSVARAEIPRNAETCRTHEARLHELPQPTATIEQKPRATAIVRPLTCNQGREWLWTAPLSTSTKPEANGADSFDVPSVNGNVKVVARARRQGQVRSPTPSDRETPPCRAPLSPVGECRASYDTSVDGGAR